MSDRYRSPNCLAAAHHACPHLGTTCDCPCHVTGAAYLSDRLPAPTITKVVPNPAWNEAVERRAIDLCTLAEPHTESWPCLDHRSEARRQLMDQWLGQDNRGAGQDNRGASEVA